MRRAFMVLGVIAPMFLSLLVVVVVAATMIFVGPEHMDSAMPFIMLSMLPAMLGALWFTVISFWCLFDILSGRVPQEQRLAWLLAWLFLNAFAVAAWVYLYEVKRQG